jgi:hypothetical protein
MRRGGGFARFVPRAPRGARSTAAPRFTPVLRSARVLWLGPVAAVTWLLVCIGLSVCVGLLACAPAQALFTAPVLVSANPALQLQADYAYDPAISADGRYVAFTGSVASQSGVWRKDLESGELELVAAGEHTGAPSISADGRYVSFTTDQQPATGREEAESDGCSSVYVRDMQEPIDAPGAFTLASAGDSSTASLTYEPPPTGGRAACGSAAAARVALSANGQEIAFTVLSPSDLTGACTGTPPALTCPTPPNQVAVRNLQTHTTTLASVTRASLGGTPTPVSGGAALSATTYGEASLSGGRPAALATSASTAALSADGNAVAWMGVNIAEQAQVDQPLPTEGHVDGYAEPLWRSLSAGRAAPTRRVLAGDDPSAPECPPACAGGLDLDWDTQAIGAQEYNGDAPEYGSFTSQAGNTTGFSNGGFGDLLDAVTPQLSADGMTVALLSTQPNYGQDPEFGQFDRTKPPPANAFVVNMTPGLTRAQAITRLTEWSSLNFSDSALAGNVDSVALSPDGTRLAFTTARIAFSLAPPALVSPPLSAAAASQLYEVNLQAGTLQLVTKGYEGQPANDSVVAAALSEDGQRLALASAASNLVYGVVNEGSDVYATEEIDSPLVHGEQSFSALPPGPAAEIPWQISASTAGSPDGSLLVYVSAPGAGTASASARLVTATSGSGTAPGHRRHAAPKPDKARRALVGRGKALTARAARSSKAHAKQGGKGSSHQHAKDKPAAQAGPLIARTSAMASGPGVLELHLIPAARYDSLLRGKNGLYATVTVTFTAPGHLRLQLTLHTSFPRRPRIYDIPDDSYRLPKSKPPKHRRTGHRGRHG